MAYLSDTPHNQEDKKGPCSTESTEPIDDSSRGVCNGNLKEATSYVEAVMPPQILTEVASPFHVISGRKRHLSLPDEESAKKIRNDSEGRETIRAKRSLYAKQKVNKERTETVNIPSQNRETDNTKEGEASTNDILRDTDNSNANGQTCMAKILDAIKMIESKMDNQHAEIKKTNEFMMKHIQEEIGKVRTEFNSRFDGLTKKVEAKVGEAVNKKIEDKVSKMSKELHEKSKKIQDKVYRVEDGLKRLEERTIPTVHEAIGDELDTLRSRIERIDNTIQGNGITNNLSESSKTNFILRNFPEREREDINYEVTRVLKDGLKLRDIEIEKAERKPNRSNNGKPGIVIAKCKSKEDKHTIMRNKNKLKDSKRYERVFIEHDLPRQQRVLNSNMRAIVNTIGRDKLQVRGSRVNVKRHDNDYSDDHRYANRHEGSSRDTYLYDPSRTYGHNERHRNDNRNDSQSDRPRSYRHHNNDTNRDANRQRDSRDRQY